MSSRSSGVPFAEFSGTWLTTWAVVRLKASGYREYESIVRLHLNPKFGDLSLTEIGALEVQEYVAGKLASGLSPRTVANHVQVLRLVFEYACSCGLVDENPTKKVVVPRVDRQEMHFLTPEQLHQLIEATAPSWRLLVAMAALTGIRKGEQLALAFSDIDLERRTLTITKSMRGGVVTAPKTKASVSQIPLPESLLPLIEQRRRQVCDPDGLVFCRADGSPLSDGTPNRVLAKSLTKAGLPSIRWHDLRHSWVVAHLQAGTDIKTLQQLGRWSSTQTLLDVYSHVVPATGGDAANRLDRMVGGQL